MSEAHLFAIGVLLAWLAGIRVYLTVFGIGIAGYFGWLDLPQALEVTSSPWVLGVSGVLALQQGFASMFTSGGLAERLARFRHRSSAFLLGRRGQCDRHWSANKRARWPLRSGSGQQRTGATDGALRGIHTERGVIPPAYGLAPPGESPLS